jgi:tetrahydromethanopterin:alpha-L-glutamate ligase
LRSVPSPVADKPRRRSARPGALGAAATRVIIMTEDPGWHGRVLEQALRRRGCEVGCVALSACGIDLARPSGLRLPGFESSLPDAVFVRGIAAGSFEQVTLRLGVLHALRQLGVVVYNDARAIERSVDKSMTSFLLKLNGLATPPTWVTESREVAMRHVMREAAAGHELVLKPLFGSQGKGLVRIASAAALVALDPYGNVFYLQRFIDAHAADWHDWRVLVVGGRAVAAMVRRGKSWINNVAQGAVCEFAALEPDLAGLAEAAARALDLDYAGVDLMRDAQGAAQVLEINSMPAWAGLQGVQSFDVAQALVDDLIGRRLMPAQATGTAP